MGNNDEGFDPYRYRSGVRVVAILDVILSIFLLGFYLLRLAVYEGKDGDMTTGLFYRYGVIKEPTPFYYFTPDFQKYYIFVWIAIFFAHTLQLIMSIILIFGAFQEGTEDSRRRCETWCSSLSFIYSSIAIELFVLIQTYAKYSINYYSLSMWIAKLSFRIIASRTVQSYVKDLSQVYSYTPPRNYPFY